ncbi:MAG: hypothetical protein FJ304_15910 [Planctomycetes bacterium]|nr:hypothetical protein [Planctomycetota bacterium]
MSYTRCAAAALVLALAGLMTAQTRATAAWDNVFQVCCNDCKPRVAYSAPCPDQCAKPEVRISYVQRTYYQPVTEYVRKSYYEPVTKKVTSYYYEPVTEYKYTTYYDPCTGCPQKVCQPVTSYRLRSQCNSVTSYVERCAMVPVTTLKPVCYQQPVVSYYYPPSSSGYFPPAPGPTVNELRENPPMVMPPKGSSDGMIPPQELPAQPGAFPKPGGTKIRPEKTVSRSSVVSVRGEVVLNDQITPRAGAKIVFMNADKPEQKEYATANAYGEFDLRLAAGNWYMYVGGENGKATYHKQISLGDRDTVDYKVVSR